MTLIFTDSFREGNNRTTTTWLSKSDRRTVWNHYLRSNPEEMKFENAPGFIKFALGENVKQSNWGDFESIRFPQTRMGVEQVFYDHFHKARAYEKAWEKYNSLSCRKDKTIAPEKI